jgi:hypothetical protein
MRNKADEKRVILIEHPFRSDWKLIEPSKLLERTPAVYRFQAVVAAGRGEKSLLPEAVRQSWNGANFPANSHRKTRPG